MKRITTNERHTIAYTKTKQGNQWTQNNKDWGGGSIERKNNGVRDILESGVFGEDQVVRQWSGKASER